MAKIADCIKQARERAKKRKFSQSFDLAVNLKGLDLKKPENRFNSEFALPEGRGKDSKIAIIADLLASSAKDHADLVIKKAEIEQLAKDKKKFKKIVREHDWFFGEAPLMPLIGKTLGIVLGPLGKMPKPLPPNANVKAFVEGAKRTTKVRLKDSPVIHISIGTEDMKDEAIAKNIEGALAFVKDKLPKGGANVRSVHLKLTMGPAVKLEV